MRRLAASLAIAIVNCCGLSVSGAETVAGEPAFVEGVHYQKLSVPVETRDPQRVEVVEVFLYTCIHCYHLEPVLERWLGRQKPDVDFHRLPLVSQRSQQMVTFAQAYFTAEALNVVPRVHMPIFAAIHEHGLDMSRPAYVRRLFVREAEVDEEEFQRVFDSFGIHSRVRQADGQSRMFRVRATPSLVVNGRYLTEVSMAGSVPAMLLVVDQLVEQERSARTLSAMEPAARNAAADAD